MAVVLLFVFAVLVMAVVLLFVFAQIAAIAICVLGTMGSKAFRRSAPRMVRRWVREREARKEECPPPPPNFE